MRPIVRQVVSTALADDPRRLGKACAGTGRISWHGSCSTGVQERRQPKSKKKQQIPLNEPAKIKEKEKTR